MFTFLLFCLVSGLAKDHQTLRELKVTKGAKIMVVGSTLNDVLSVTAPTEQEMKEAAKTTATKEPLSQQKVGLVNFLEFCQESLPACQMTVFHYRKVRILLPMNFAWRYYLLVNRISQKASHANVHQFKENSLPAGQ